MERYIRRYIWQVLLGGIVMMALVFSYILPVSVLTTEWRVHRLDYNDICEIQPKLTGKGFIIDYVDGRQFQVDRESLSAFFKRANFNIRPLSKYYQKTADTYLFNNCRTIEREEAQATDCNPMVKGLNVFYVRGFLKVNPQMFVVIYGDGDFENCNCDDPKVILGKKPYCKLVYHGTKKDILRRARECGLGDYFPEKSCK